MSDRLFFKPSRLLDRTKKKAKTILDCRLDQELQDMMKSEGKDVPIDMTSGAFDRRYMIENPNKDGVIETRKLGNHPGFSQVIMSTTEQARKEYGGILMHEYSADPLPETKGKAKVHLKSRIKFREIVRWIGENKETLINGTSDVVVAVLHYFTDTKTLRSITNDDDMLFSLVNRWPWCPTIGPGAMLAGIREQAGFTWWPHEANKLNVLEWSNYGFNKMGRPGATKSLVSLLKQGHDLEWFGLKRGEEFFSYFSLSQLALVFLAEQHASKASGILAINCGRESRFLHSRVTQVHMETKARRGVNPDQVVLIPVRGMTRADIYTRREVDMCRQIEAERGSKAEPQETLSLSFFLDRFYDTRNSLDEEKAKGFASRAFTDGAISALHGLLFAFSMYGSRQSKITISPQDLLVASGLSPERARRKDVQNELVDNLKSLSCIYIRNTKKTGSYKEEPIVHVVITGEDEAPSMLDVKIADVLCSGIRDAQTGKIGKHFWPLPGSAWNVEGERRLRYTALAISIAHQLRNNYRFRTSRSHPVSWKVKTLFDKAGMKYKPSHAARDLARIEDDLLLMQKNGVLGSFDWRSGGIKDKVCTIHASSWSLKFLRGESRPQEKLPLQTGKAVVTGRDLRAWRKTVKLSQKNLAEIAGCGVNTIARAEQKAEKEISRRLLAKLKEVWGSNYPPYRLD